VARALSKLGYCSRAQARLLVRDGHVTVNGRRCRDPETRVDPALDRIRVHGRDPAVPARRYFMLNKPRGLVTTRADEQGRATVFRCFENASLPYLAPVGRLDRASEGLLLFTNDSAWAAAITDPATHIDKIYHVQIDRLPDTALLDRLRYGVVVQGELLAVKAARELRRGERNAWLELTLDEGRNRHLRRLLEACGCDVLRLVRIAVGPLRLGDLAAGAWRELSAEEVQSLSRARPRTR
jgi:23S rRNA pseudouridine2605 synthase